MSTPENIAPLTTREFRRLTNLPAIRQACAARARRIALTAQAIANDEVGADDAPRFRVEVGTRPGGRGYARAVTPDAEREFGSSITQRRRWLGRAARAVDRTGG